MQDFFYLFHALNIYEYNKDIDKDALQILKYEMEKYY